MKQDANAVKWRNRRFNHLNAYSWEPKKEATRSYFSRRNWAGQPSYWFCCTDFRLCLLYWYEQIVSFAWQLAWADQSHGCTCFMCNSEKRKWYGNSWQGRPIQERREIMRAEQSDC